MKERINGAILYFMAGIAFVFIVLVIVIFVSKDTAMANEEDTSLISEDLSLSEDDVDLSDMIEYEAVVDTVRVIDDGTSAKIYITDMDKHVLVFSFDNPEILLLKQGDHIIVYVDKKYEDSDVIYIKYYRQFGFISKSV